MKQNFYPYLLCLLLGIGSLTNAAGQSACVGFKTFTQGGWGANCNGNNPGCYRDANFAAAFPNGLTIGCAGGNTLKLTTANAVNAFEPANGTPSTLIQNYDDVTSSTAGVLAGQLVALTLNVGFDSFDPNFSTTTVLLSNQIINIPGSPFNGKTVGQFLAIANDVVGGCSSAYTPSEVNSVADIINKNYDNGTSDNGNLKCSVIKIEITATDNVCPNGNTGSINLTIVEGTAPFVINWSNGATSEDVSGLTSGDYYVIVKDANNLSDTAFATITEPTVIVSNITASPVSCFGGSNGSLNLTVSGGTAPYTFLWSNGATTQNLSGLPAGNYSVGIKDDNGCPSANLEIITEPTELLISTTHTDLLCHGGNNASIDLTVTGGTEDYTYDWSNGETTQDLSNLTAGTYYVTVTDANGCAKSDTVTITEPTELVISTTHTNVSCNGGNNASIDLSVSGGTEAYSYSWSNGATTQDVSDLTAGTYFVTVTDANGCVKSDTATITEPTKLTIGVSKSDISCNNANDGSINITVGGGVTPYTFKWSNDSTSEDLNHLAAGVYSVTVTDANGCTIDANAEIVNPAPLALNINVVNVSCFGGTDGSAIATVTGGTTPYSISWNTSPVQTGLSATHLAAGSYTISITDAHGCPISKSISIAPPAPCTGFLTYTQGGWGAKPTGNNPAVYVVNNFASAFPNGLTIGTGSRLLKLTSAKAIEDFLPSSGTPAVLPVGTKTNPGSTYSNTLAGQLVALTLSVGFDAANPNFAPSSTALGDVIIGSGTFAGKSVNQLLVIANNAIGGVATGYSLSDINAALTSINENYDGGINKGFLYCPCSPAGRFAILDANDNRDLTLMNASEGTINCAPNPFVNEARVNFTVSYDSYAKVELYNFSGELVSTIFTGNISANQSIDLSLQTENLPTGVYFCKLITDQGYSVKKVVKVD